MSNKELEECIINVKPLKVLFVEDNIEFAKQTIKLFNNFFNNVTLAINGADGIEKFKTANFDLVISDINMPDIDGISMIRELKTINRNIPIIMLTAHDDSKLIIECIQIGVDGYLLKPIQLEEMLIILQKISQQSIYRKELSKIVLNSDFTWIASTSELLYCNALVKLTSNEIKFLSGLITAKGSIIQYDKIDEIVFNKDEYDKKRTINLTTRLRNKIGNNLIESVYGEGYRIRIDNKHT